MCPEAAYILCSFLILIFIVLGFILPSKINKAEKEWRKVKSQKWEKDVWGFHSRHRDGPWLNFVDYPVIKYSSCAEKKRFYSDWLIIHDGFIIVNPGPVTDYKSIKDRNAVSYDFQRKRTYAWDGCTPKISFYWFAFIGTPDWWQKIHRIKTSKIVTETEAAKISVSTQKKEVFWPLAHHASLIHDGLYQYLNIIPISKKEVDNLFKEMLLDSEIHPFIAGIYHFFVRRFGARKIPEDLKNANHTTVWENPIDFSKIKLTEP